jgi:hypothetical protein
LSFSFLFLCCTSRAPTIPNQQLPRQFFLEHGALSHLIHQFLRQVYKSPPEEAWQPNGTFFLSFLRLVSDLQTCT